MPIGLWGYSYKSYGKMMPWSNLNVVYLKGGGEWRGKGGRKRGGKREGKGERHRKELDRMEMQEGWVGNEDEETRLNKDSDIRIEKEQFRKGLWLARELFEGGGRQSGEGSSVTAMVETVRYDVVE